MALRPETTSELENLITESHVVFLMKLATFFLLLNNKEKTKLVMKLQEIELSNKETQENSHNTQR